MKLFKEHDQVFIKLSPLLFLLRENRARLVSQLCAHPSTRYRKAGGFLPSPTSRTSETSGGTGRTHGPGIQALKTIWPTSGLQILVLTAPGRLGSRNN